MINMPWTKKEKFTGLEIEDNYVKLAQAQKFAGSRKIVKLAVKKLTSSSDEDTVAALSSLVAEVKSEIGHLTLCIPRHKVTVRFLSFPTVKDQEIEGMIGLQSVKELPFSKEEIISDYLVTERTKDGYAKVALVIVQQDVINRYLSILKKAGLEPERITFTTEALLDWYRAVFRKQTTKTCLALIDIDADNTDVAIFNGAYLGFTRGLNIGNEQISEHTDLKAKLIEEIRWTIEGYRRLAKTKEIEKLLIVQEDDDRQGLNALLAEEFSLSCETIAPLKNISCEKGISATQFSSKLSLLRVLGVVIDSQERRLNLLSKDLRDKQEIELRKKRVYTTVALVLGIALVALGIFAKKIYNKRLRISYLDREIEMTAPQAEDVENMLRKIRLIENRREITGSTIDILAVLHNLVPQEISLSSFIYDEDNKLVVLQGITANMSITFNFINTLEKSPYFKNVQLKYASKEKAKASGFTEFKIECNLEL